MVTIYNNPAAITFLPRTVAWANVKRTLADSWQFVPYLTPTQCTDTAAPAVGSADFEYDFGTMKREDRTAKAFYTPYALLGYYVQIMIQQPGFAPQPVWTGIITDDEPMFDRPNVAAGVQRLRAYQFPHLLERQTIRTAIAEATSGKQTLHWVPRFNVRSRIGISLDGNRSESEGPDGVYLFAKDGELWNSLQIVQYLCKYHAPEGLTIQLAGQADVLTSIEDEWDFEGDDLWSALNALIDRRRGLGFYPWTPGDGTLYLWIFTLTERDIQFGTRTLPANPLQTFFALPTDRPWTHVTEDLRFRRTTVNQYDKVIVRGQRAKVTGTFAFEDETLKKGWKTELEDDYYNALGSDEEENDFYRSKEKFDGVFTKFTVPNSWNGEVGNGEGASKSQIRLKSSQDGSMEPSADGAFYFVDKIFLRDTPFRKGFDYTQDPPTDNNPEDEEPEFRSLFVIVKDAEGGTHTNTDKFHIVDRLAPQDGISNVSVTPLDKRLGFQLGAYPQHTFAVGSWSDPGPSSAEPEFDYEQLLVTATFEGDERPQITIENFAGSSAEASRTLIVDVPNAEYWYVAPGTVVDVGEDGKLERIAESNTVLRDDKEKLDGIAAFLAAWYGVPRQAVQIPLQQLGLFVQIGTLLTDIRTVQLSEPVRTVVTDRRIDFRSQTTEIGTSYQGLDIAVAVASYEERRRKKRAIL